MYLKKIHWVIIPSSYFLGDFFMMSGSAGLNDKAVAGNPSVTRFTHSNYTELKPSGIPRIELKNILTTSPMLELIMYLMKAFMLQ